MQRPPAAFAIPGNLSTRTGGYIYERRMLETLPEVGQPMRHIELPVSFPHPTDDAQHETAVRLRALSPDTALILDGLVFGSIDTGILSSLACPVIAMLHHPLGLEAGLPPDRAAALIRREAANLRHAAHVVVPSPHTRDILTAQFGVAPDDISVALPGFDRPPAPEERVPRADPPLILSVGIICARKGHDVLLDALARLRHLDWQAAIVGMTHDEAVREALLRQRGHLGLDARVRFTGTIDEPALDKLFREACVFALATRYEGYGMVLSEAQLYGLPIVTCAVGAVPQTVSGHDALLVPADDAPAFANALGRVLSEPGLHARLSQGSRDAGQRLPRWCDAARVMLAALDRVRAAAMG